MFVKTSVAVALFASYVAAQAGANSTIDPNTVDTTTRSQWCLGQRNTCGTLCSGEVASNDCDVATLAVDCTCQANNSAPGLQYYQNTMSTFICQQIFANCQRQNAGVAAAQAVCEANEQRNCGHLDPANFTADTVSTSPSPTPSPTGTSAPAPAGTDAATSTSTAAAVTIMPGQNFGTGAIALGVAAAFGYML